MNKSNKLNSSTPKLLVEILGEGGSLSIFMDNSDAEPAFIFSSFESDLTDEGLGIDKKETYASFEEAFRNVENYQWYKLHLSIVHDDVKVSVISALRNRLREDKVDASQLEYSKYRLERILEIELDGSYFPVK